MNIELHLQKIQQEYAVLRFCLSLISGLTEYSWILSTAPILNALQYLFCLKYMKKNPRTFESVSGTFKAFPDKIWRMTPSIYLFIFLRIALRRELGLEICRLLACSSQGSVLTYTFIFFPSSICGHLPKN